MIAAKLVQLQRDHQAAVGMRRVATGVTHAIRAKHVWLRDARNRYARRHTYKT